MIGNYKKIDNMIKDLIIVREDGSTTNAKFVAKTLANGIGTSKAYPSYDNIPSKNSNFF